MHIGLSDVRRTSRSCCSISASVVASVEDVSSITARISGGTCRSGICSVQSHSFVARGSQALSIWSASSLILETSSGLPVFLTKNHFSAVIKVGPECGKEFCIVDTEHKWGFDWVLVIVNILVCTLEDL